MHECVCVCVCEPMLLLLNLKFKMPATLYSFPARRNRRRARERDRVQVEGGCGQRVQGGRPSMSCCWTLAKNALAVSRCRCRPRSCQSRRHKFWAQPASPRLACLANEMKARARVCERVRESVCVRRTPARMRAKNPQAARWLAIRCRKRGDADGNGGKGGDGDGDGGGCLS